jgi:hypothetical protein
METLELPSQYFHFASQFHGEFKSRPSKPSPEYYGFVNACLSKKMGKPKPTYLIILLIDRYKLKLYQKYEIFVYK